MKTKGEAFIQSGRYPAMVQYRERQCKFEITIPKGRPRCKEFTLPERDRKNQRVTVRLVPLKAEN